MNKLNLRVTLGQFLGALSIFFASVAYAQGEDQNASSRETKFIADSLLKVLSQCPNRIWPDLKVPMLDILLINKDLPRQLLVSPRNNSYVTVPNEKLPPRVFSSAFSLIQFENRDVLYVDSQIGRYSADAPLVGFQFAIHEAFHIMDQKEWNRPEMGERGVSIPLLTEPRIARHMLYINLKKAFIEKQNMNHYLGKAKYWYQEWVKADATEFTSTTDGYEGSAQYVDTIATLLNIRGCKVPEAALEQDAIQMPVLQGESYVGFIALDSDGYYIGGLASLLLRFRFPSLNWQARLAIGDTPVKVLLEKINPIAEPQNQKIAEKIHENIQEMDSDINSYLRDTQEQMQKPTAIYISVPTEAVKTSYSPKGFYNDRHTGVHYIPMAAELTFDLTDRNSRLTSKQDAVFFEFGKTDPCPGFWNFVVDSSAIQSKGDLRFELASSLFEGSFLAKEKVDSKGRQWLCVQN